MGYHRPIFAPNSPIPKSRKFPQTGCRSYLRAMNVQIFGVQKDADTRKALRFFKERRIPVHFVYFKIKGPSKG